MKERTNLRLLEVCRILTNWLQGLLAALKEKNRQQIHSVRESQAFTKNERSIFHTLDKNRTEWLRFSSLTVWDAWRVKRSAARISQVFCSSSRHGIG